VAEALRRGLERWGWGAGASRLLAGHTEAHEALEADLASWLGAEAALVFPTGYTTNLGALTALAGRGDPVVMDRACHASLYDAAAMARARLVRYPQCDAAAAAEVLAAEADGPGRRLLVTDAVFSMDGRRAPLSALVAAAQAHGAALLLDEAHALGVLGESGAGLAEEHGLGDKTTVRVGTLSKALGGVGGFVAASREGIDLLVNRARPFIYTTALPPAACEAAREALRILRAEPERRRRLHDLSRTLRTRLEEEGFDLGPGGNEETGAAAPPTPIVPVLFGEPERALAAAAALLERGIFCPAIRPPTVPAGTSRLRVSLTAAHTEEDVDRLVAALVAARNVA
jgi:8-amino-7-oxononanoate synthase